MERDEPGCLVRLGSSFRQRSPEDTLCIAREVMQSLGVSRVTDITRLDRLGLPVYTSVRPRGALLQVHAGKGLRPVESEIGALMEAIEFTVAEPEHHRWRCHKRSVDAIAKQLGCGLAFADLVPKWRLNLAGDEFVDAVSCEELGTGRRVMLPAELVFLPYMPRHGNELFGWTGNGLASGNSGDEATLHGLFEVLERDALAMSRIDNASCRIESSSLPEPFCTLASTWFELGIELVVRCVDNAARLACFEAFLYEPESTDVNLVRGSGLHVDREIALSRAICEAAQSRLSGIHGGREDITMFYGKYKKAAKDRLAAEQRVLEEVFDRTGSTTWKSIPHEGCIGRDIPEVLAKLLKRLSRYGFPSVFVYRFPKLMDALHVVKVIVPKCEELEHGTERIGSRLLARIMASSPPHSP